MRGAITVEWTDLDAAVSFRSTGVSGAELGIFDAVSRAVLQSVEATFHYHKLNGDQLEPHSRNREDHRIAPIAQVADS